MKLFVYDISFFFPILVWLGMNLPEKPFIPAKVSEKKGLLQTFFSGEEESARDRLQRQQVVNELNYEMESAVG